jgi:hypothetical protein
MYKSSARVWEGGASVSYPGRSWSVAGFRTAADGSGGLRYHKDRRQTILGIFGMKGNSG